MAVSPPGNFTGMEQDDIVAYFHNGVHIVGVDNGSDIVVLGDIADQFINDEGRFGVKAGVGLVAKKVG